MFKCFKNPPRVEKVNKKTVSGMINPEYAFLKNGIKVALVVGHNSKKQGAVNYLGETEFSFNSRIARKLQIKLLEARIDNIIVFRPSSGGYRHECASVAARVKEEECTHAIMLHFNSASSKVRGAEVLVAPSPSTYDEDFARMLLKMLEIDFRFKNRGVKLVEKGHNGFLMLDECNKVGCTSVLVEPCFANTRNHESRIIFENEDSYVNCLFDTINHTWMKKEET